MDIENKYLPSKEDREQFLEVRIAEYKKQIFGAQVEICLAAGNKKEIDNLEYNINNRIKDVDTLTEFLDNLE